MVAPRRWLLGGADATAALALPSRRPGLRTPLLHLACHAASPAHAAAPTPHAHAQCSAPTDRPTQLTTRQRHTSPCRLLPCALPQDKRELLYHVYTLFHRGRLADSGASVPVAEPSADQKAAWLSAWALPGLGRFRAMEESAREALVADAMESVLEETLRLNKRISSQLQAAEAKLSSRAASAEAARRAVRDAAAAVEAALRAQPQQGQELPSVSPGNPFD